jgi:hypothetical protein
MTITSLRARSAEPTGADEEFTSAIRHWRDRGDWNRQWVTLRNLAEYLARAEREDAAAVIMGAVDAHGPPAYGTEALRLETARSLIERQLGLRRCTSHPTGPAVARATDRRLPVRSTAGGCAAAYPGGP